MFFHSLSVERDFNEGSREGVPPRTSPKDSKARRIMNVEKPDGDREIVTELRFRAHMIHLGFSERTPLEETLERMRATKLQDLDHLQFKEWTRKYWSSPKS